ncbi:hypothetical protein R70006_07656 [Paraburkholderia domus]|nr:hypothetical protein R70006_07656 [Paraburkholderia domus]CAE6966156.1 hypothetical protein R75471_07029 [Paraburkholderia domus]
MDMVRLDFHDRHLARRTHPASLFDDERHRIGLIGQPQPSSKLRVLVVPRIEENASTHQDSMDLRDHGRYPPHVEIRLSRPGSTRHTLTDIAAHRFFPIALVGHVDREFAGIFRDLKLWVGQHE